MNPDDESTRRNEVPEAPEEPETVGGAASGTPPTVALTSKRQAFRDIRRQLQDTDLASPGVQKLLLDELEQSEAARDVLQGFVERYHEADKRAAILQEKVKTNKAIEVFFAVGIGVGSAIVGVVPTLWKNPPDGQIALGIGIALVVGACVGRIVRQ